MNSKITRDNPAPEAIKQMKASVYNFPDTRWAAFENHDIGHHDAGHLQFLAIGPQNTHKEVPAKMPDTARGFGWRYVHIGWVNLQTGKIEEK